MSDPSYKFRFDQGQQALERSASAKGYLNSGNLLHDLQTYGQQSASQEYNNEYNRLAQLSGANFSPGNAGGNYMSGQNNVLANNAQMYGALGTLGRSLYNYAAS